MIVHCSSVWHAALASFPSGNDFPVQSSFLSGNEDFGPISGKANLVRRRPGGRHTSKGADWRRDWQKRLFPDGNCSKGVCRILLRKPEGKEFIILELEPQGAQRISAGWLGLFGKAFQPRPTSPAHGAD